MNINKLEFDLNNFNETVRKDSLAELASLLVQGKIEVQPENNWVNLHCHSFFSYNGYGMSPSALVWKAKTLGLNIIGLVDFDTLDGIDEFHQAGQTLKIKSIASMETRAYLPYYLKSELNSPGEPGIAYQMISGLNTSILSNPLDKPFSEDLLVKSHNRNNSIISRINNLLPEVMLNYKTEVLSLTPNNNPTERHICEAYRKKSETVFPEDQLRIEYWSRATNIEQAFIKGILHDRVKFEAFLRARLMKQGGIAYQPPSPSNFPVLADVNKHALALNGIPVMAWLDGLSSGEDNIHELIKYHISQGTKGLNIIPDRNYNIKDVQLKQKKVQKLYEFVEIAESYNLPIMVGTELNAPGLKFVDDFNSPELAPLLPTFIKGAEIFYGHSIEQSRSGNGYCSQWSEGSFKTTADRNDYYQSIGKNYAYESQL